MKTDKKSKQNISTGKKIQRYRQNQLKRDPARDELIKNQVLSAIKSSGKFGNEYQKLSKKVKGGKKDTNGGSGPLDFITCQGIVGWILRVLGLNYW